jgi:tRNA(His) 5'-end guanylyltransferase
VDAEQTFERVTESNISIIIELLSILSQSKRERFKEEYQNLFNESKFWKLTTSQSVGVKREMYRLVGVLCDEDHGIIMFLKV